MPRTRPNTPDPTPEEFAARCLAIQREHDEQRKRGFRGRKPWHRAGKATRRYKRRAGGNH